MKFFCKYMSFYSFVQKSKESQYIDTFGDSFEKRKKNNNFINNLHL